MTSNNPHTTVGDAVAESRATTAVGYGFIDETYEHAGDDNYKHLARVQPHGKNTTFLAQMGVMADGDVHPPSLEGENDVPVLYAMRGDRTPIIISLLYSTENEVPDYDPGERRIGHALSDAHIYFDVDGNITIESDGGATVTLQDDGTVVINGGSKGAIYDISTTSADGYLTSITPERRSDILI